MPAWVVCAESHFSLLIALDQHPTQPNGPPSSLTRLSYYDGLANQEQPIILTLSNNELQVATKKLQEVTKHEEDSLGMKKQTDNTLVAPLEHVIHTRWPNVLIHWSGSDPIL